ncbi:MAG TPA: Ig-like domain-containing protein, partial [Spirochaetota bacterium]|nr:Ig-like domain-containing protein [Spirochaetota bacterium]
MKTNKINTVLVSLATAVIFIVGAGCHNSFFFGNPSDPTPTTTISAANRGSLRIYIEKNIKTRTIIADANAITFDQYSIEMTSDDGFADRSGDFTASVADFNNIEAGTWNIAVKAKRSGQVLATGARSGITIAANTTTDLTVDIKLIQSATGNVKVRISFPKISEIGYVGAKLLGEAADTPLAIIDNSPDVDHKMVAFERNNVASGVKDLLLTFRKGDASGTILGMYRETINIFDNLTSDKWIDNNGVLQAVLSYPATYFASTNSNLFDLTTDSGRAFTPPFNSSIYYYTLNVAHSQDTIKIIPTLSISGQSVKYRLNGAAGYSYPASGIQSDPLNLNGGDNTIDVEVTAQDRITKSYYKILVNRAPKPGVPVISGVENGYSYINDMTFSLSSADSASIRYTMTNDGSDPSDPTAASSLYSDPIDLTSGAGTKTIYKIKAVGFNSFGDASDVGGVWTVTIDKKPPTITDLDPTDDAENVDVSVDLVITFDEDVTIDQPDKEVIIYRRGSGLFDYEFERIPIDDPRVTWAGNRVTINPTKEFKSKLKYYVIIDNGAIRDIAGNSFAGIDHSSTWNFTIIDTGAPFIIDISSDPVSGSFKQGGVISIKVQFNETVWVLGFPTLSLNSGPTKATFSYGGGGTGSDTLTFTYTVGADDNTADLDVTSVNLPTGATIRDGASHNAILSIPAPPNRLRDNSDIVVDTIKPKIMSGATMSADNSYVTITFSEGVYTNAGASGG